MGRNGTGARDSRSLCALIIAASLMGGCSSQPPPKTQAQVPASITQFYARDPVLPKGEKTVLCYGVESAKTVSLAPPVDKVWPALTRCFEIAPAQATTYKLTATGSDGKPVTKSVTVQVGAARPHIIEVSVGKLEVSTKEQVMVCFKARNATTVNVTPGKKFSRVVMSPNDGCVVDWPVKTTTYTVTISNADGISDTEHVTVRVK